MRKYLPLRPRQYAEEMETLLIRLATHGAVVDIDGEAQRIARSCGMSPVVALRDFQKTRVVRSGWETFTTEGCGAGTPLALLQMSA